MSTLNSYFNTRKSRANVAQHEKTDVETSKACAIQAPQPVYESLKIINTKPKNRLSAIEKKNQPDAQRNNILNYLSPVRKCAVQCNKATVEAEEEEYTHTLCKIRVNIPVSHVWSNILEEFDPKSQINQFADLVFEDKTEEVLDKERNTNSLIVGRRRTRDVIEDQVDVTRNVRIRTGKHHPSSTVMMNIFCMDDFYEDNEEVLSRPTRSKHTRQETNDFLLLIVDELLTLSDNTWIQAIE